MTIVFGCFKQVNQLICCVQNVSKKWTARLKKKHIHHLSPNYLKYQSTVGPAPSISPKMNLAEIF